MKKFLSILLIVTMVFLFTACGSELEGTKGTFQGNGYSVSWSKGFLKNTITLKVIPAEGVDLFAEGYSFSENLYNYETGADGNPIIPFTMEKEQKKANMVYTINPIKDYVTEDGYHASVTIVDNCGSESVDSLCSFVVNVSVSKEIPLSLSVDYIDPTSLYSQAVIYGDGEFGASYSITDKGIDVAISNPYGDTWSVISCDKYFEVGEIYYSNAKAIVPVVGVAKGSGFVTVKNLQRGAKYKLYLGSQPYGTEDAVLGYNVMLFSISAEKESTSVKEAKGYTEAKKKSKTSKAAVGVDVDEIQIPADLNVVSVSVSTGTKYEYSSQTTVIGGGSGSSTAGTAEDNETKTAREFKQKENKDYQKALDEINGKSTGPSVFESEEDKQSFIEALERYEQEMSMPERVSADNAELSTIEFKMTDSEQHENSYVILSAKETTIEAVISNYDVFEHDTTVIVVKGTNVNLLTSDLFSAAIYQIGDQIYVLEIVGVRYTEQQAKDRVAEFIK